MTAPHALLLALLPGALLGCSCSTSSGESANGGSGGAETSDDREQDLPPVRTYAIVNTYPHDTLAYTQGLFFHEGRLYESTGRMEESTVRMVVPETGKVLLRHDLDEELFGEGLAMWKGLIIQLTWKSGKAIVYDARSFVEVNRYDYPGQGWGLTFDGDHLIMSDGTDKLRYLDPETFEVQRTLAVTYVNPNTGESQPLPDLNELEIIEGEIWANLYQMELIARIDPETGKVSSWIDFTGLQAKQKVKDRAQDVLNGIAYDAENKRIFITGKYWPNLYEIRVVEAR